MVDSVSVAVGGEVAAWVTDVVVVEETGGEGQESQRDACAQAFDGAPAVGFEGELALAGPEHRFDPLADRSEGAVAMGFVAAVGAQEVRAEGGHDLFELFAGEAFVGHDGVAVQVDPLEHLGGDDALGGVGGASSKAIGIPSGAHSR
jgi:hypothetical protein